MAGETNAKRVAILGMGGVGGFLGARLLSGDRSPGTEIIFVARGETYKALSEGGLVFESGGTRTVVRPDQLIESGAVTEAADLVLLATKSTGLRSAVSENQTLFSEKTLVLPLQNMVDAASRIRPIVNGAQVIDTCIYLISNVKRPGQVRHLGGPGKIVAGFPEKERHTWFFSLLEKTGLEIRLREDIEVQLWTKFLFISSLGALTAAYGLDFGSLLRSQLHWARWQRLMEELLQLAQASGVPLRSSAILEAREVVRNFPANSRSSFQLDVAEGREGEKEVLIDEVIAKSRLLGLSPVTYDLMEELIRANIRTSRKETDG
ncbi:ketopantoate reductase family protein [Cyclobacterium xiamenense]|uniref:ketopantoate reductase family protein n=1 Tax=Cyclobacterium xiamenense TaxID=1297121 RepID=UPI0035D0732A